MKITAQAVITYEDGTIEAVDVEVEYDPSTGHVAMQMDPAIVLPPGATLVVGLDPDLFPPKADPRMN